MTHNEFKKWMQVLVHRKDFVNKIRVRLRKRYQTFFKDYVYNGFDEQVINHRAELIQLMKNDRYYRNKNGSINEGRLLTWRQNMFYVCWLGHDDVREKRKSTRPSSYFNHRFIDELNKRGDDINESRLALYHHIYIVKFHGQTLLYPTIEGKQRCLEYIQCIEASKKRKKLLVEKLKRIDEERRADMIKRSDAIYYHSLQKRHHRDTEDDIRFKRSFRRNNRPNCFYDEQFIRKFKRTFNALACRNSPLLACREAVSIASSIDLHIILYKPLDDATVCLRIYPSKEKKLRSMLLLDKTSNKYQFTKI